MPCVTAFSTSGCSSSGGSSPASASGADGDLDVEPVAEADPLDRQEPLDQRQLARDGDARLAPERERLAQEVGEQQAHPPRRGRIDRRQRADRVQAVEQEVRVDLRAQRAQLGFAREHLHLQRAALGLARLLER